MTTIITANYQKPAWVKMPLSEFNGVGSTITLELQQEAVCLRLCLNYKNIMMVLNVAIPEPLGVQVTAFGTRDCFKIFV